MKKILTSLLLSICICAIPLTAFAAYSNRATISYYRNGYSYGWDYGLNSVARESYYTGSSAYGLIDYSGRTSWSSPRAVIINSYGTYRTNTVELTSSGTSSARLYNMTAPQGESTNVLLMGSSAQTGADSISLSFTPY